MAFDGRHKWLGFVGGPRGQDRPGGIVLNMGKADESFTVYDHPMPLIFKKVESIPDAELRAMFAGTVQK